MLLLIVYIGMISILTFNNNQGNIYDWEFLGSYSCITTVVMATAIFLLIYNLNIKNSIIKKIITSISSNSFEMYLFSYIIDSICYDMIYKYTKGETKVWYAVFTVPVIFIITYILSVIINFILRQFKRLNIYSKIKKLKVIIAMRKIKRLNSGMEENNNEKNINNSANI